MKIMLARLQYLIKLVSVRYSQILDSDMQNVLIMKLFIDENLLDVQS
jgi:hypothetical protein